MNETIMLDGPKSVTLAPQHLAYILDLLSDQPFKKSAPIITSMMDQLKMITHPTNPPNPPDPIPEPKT